MHPDGQESKEAAKTDDSELTKIQGLQILPESTESLYLETSVACF